MRVRTMISALALMAIALPTGVRAQAWIMRQAPQARGYLLLGGIDYDLSELNGAMAERGFGAVSDRRPTLGGGAHIELGRWIVGAEGYGLLPSDADTPLADWSERVSGGAGLVNVGYAVLRLGGTTVAPMVGFGVGMLSVKFTERSTPTFDELIGDPGRTSSLRRFAMLFQPALAIDHLVPVGERDGALCGLNVGIRAGYTFSPVASDWYLDKVRLPGGPDQAMEGAFVRVAIGIGWRPTGARAGANGE